MSITLVRALVTMKEVKELLNRPFWRPGMKVSNEPDEVGFHATPRVAATAWPRSTSQPTSLPLFTYSSGAKSL